ncbi:hypothetical protein [Acidianus sp. HS-5]|nr:hypothetical protein [Acidianus sp. HS-5]BDC19523.1 hypothetical protein HS5_24130 [Acidianus sp. HS-5]
MKNIIEDLVKKYKILVLEIVIKGLLESYAIEEFYEDEALDYLELR